MAKAPSGASGQKGAAPKPADARPAASKAPGSKAAAAKPAAFEMGRSRPDGKSGKFPRNGKSGRRDDAPRAPVRMEQRRVRVDGGPGVSVFKISQVDVSSRVEQSARYTVEFDGHGPIAFDRLGEARARSKEPVPALPAEEASSEAGDAPAEGAAGADPAAAEGEAGSDPA